MPLILWLASLLGSLLSGLITFFAQYLTKRLAIVAIVVSAIAAFTIGFFAALVALINTIVASAPAEINQAIIWFVPSNASSCVAVVLTAHAIRWVYEWNIKIVQFRL